VSQSNEQWWTHTDTGGVRACETAEERTVMCNTDANIMRGESLPDFCTESCPVLDSRGVNRAKVAEGAGRAELLVTIMNP